MKREEIEKIANLIEQMLTISKRVILTRPGWIAYHPINLSNNDGYNIGAIATAMANKAIDKGFVSAKSLEKSFNGRAYKPTTFFDVERQRFIVKCLVYEKQKEMHLILIGK